jgi:hypothetical protein
MLPFGKPPGEIKFLSIQGPAGRKLIGRYGATFKNKPVVAPCRNADTNTIAMKKPI